MAIKIRVFLGSLRFLLLVVSTISIGVIGTSLHILQNGGEGPEDTTWTRIHREKRMTVGVDIGFPPFALYNPDNPALPQGIDVDLAQALGEELGLQVNIVLVGFDSRYDALFLGRVDMLIAAVRPNPGQRALVAYSLPYFDGGQVFVGLDRDKLPSGWQDLWGQSLGVEFASTGDNAARTVAQVYNFSLKRLLSAQQVLEKVWNGEVEYGLVNHLSARTFAHSHDGLYIAPQPVLSDPYVVAIRRSDWKLLIELNRALDRLHQNGKLEAILARWL